MTTRADSPVRAANREAQEPRSVHPTQRRFHPFLRALLPPPEHTLLLGTCLTPGARAEQAWRHWVARVGDPKAYLERDEAGLKGLLPFLEHALAANCIDPGNEFLTYLRVSTLREALRSDIYRTVVAEVVSALQRAGLPLIVLKGAALSETVYERPNIRHNHAIDLLMRESDFTAAIDVVSRLAFKRTTPSRRHSAAHQAFVHETGLPLVLHQRPFFLPYYHADDSGLWERAVQASIGGAPTRVLSRADALVHVCGHASYSRSRSNLRWVCDALFLAQRHPRPDWRVLVDEIEARHLVMPLTVMLDYLNREFGAEIPAQVLDALAARPVDDDPAAHEAALVCATLGTSPIKAFNRLQGNWSDRARLLRFLLTPPRGYLRWRYGINQPLAAPLVYAYRPLKFLVRRVARTLGSRQRGQPSGG